MTNFCIFVYNLSFFPFAVYLCMCFCVSFRFISRYCSSIHFINVKHINFIAHIQLLCASRRRSVKSEHFSMVNSVFFLCVSGFCCLRVSSKLNIYICMYIYEYQLLASYHHVFVFVYVLSVVGRSISDARSLLLSTFYNIFFSI